MSYGYTFDEEMREKLAKAVEAYLKDNQARAKLNAVIMEIQQPLIDKLDAIREIVKQ